MSARPAADLGRALLVIGWREPVALPDWGIHTIKTKIDTGARTSAIHVDTIRHLPGNRVSFDVITSVRTDSRGRRLIRRRPVETAIVRTSRVRNSAGRCEERLVVSTTLRFGPVEREIELSLVSRKRMLCRLLLGRMALKHGFLIDPTHARLLTAPAGHAPQHGHPNGHAPGHPGGHGRARTPPHKGARA